jgi:integrase
MGVYFNLNLKKKKSLYRNDEEVSVSVYYYFNKKKLNVSTNVKVKLKDWDEDWKRRHSKNPVKSSDENHKEKNHIIKQKVSEVENIVQQIKLNNELESVELVKSYLNKHNKERVKKSIKKVHFLYLLGEYKKHIDKDMILREGYKKSIRTCLKRIEDFVFIYQNKVKYNLLVTDIDEDFQDGLLKYLSSLNEQPSTIRKRFKILVSLINWCRERGFTDHQIKVKKFSYDFKREVIYLERDEVLKLFNFSEFNYTNENHTKYTDEYMVDNLKGGKSVTYTNLEVYKDMLIFGCGVGCRFGDLVKLRLDNYEFSSDRTKGWIVYRMEKSRSSKEIKVPTNKLTFEIWKKYSKNKTRKDFIFPRTLKGNSISNQKMNKHLKFIGFKVGLNRGVKQPKFNLQGQPLEGTDISQPLHDLISSHIMRRTFIREGLDSGIKPRILMELSGHTTEKVFKRYFDTLPREIDEEGRKLFSFDLEKVTNSKDEVKPIPKNKKSVEDELIRLKSLFDKGLIPDNIYNQKVSELL